MQIRLHDPAMICVITNADRVCFSVVHAPSSYMGHICGSLHRDLSSSLRVFLLLYCCCQRRWAKTVCVHSPSHLDLGASLSNGFFYVVSESDIRVRLFLVYVILSGLFTLLLRSLSLLYRPTIHLQRWFTCKKTLEEVLPAS